MAEAERLADRVGLLADGALVADGTPTDLVDEHGGSSRLTIETAAKPAAFDELRIRWNSRATREGESRSPTTDSIVVRAVTLQRSATSSTTSRNGKSRTRDSSGQNPDSRRSISNSRPGRTRPDGRGGSKPRWRDRNRNAGRRTDVGG
ncbi:hypothetical protein D8S78_08690 [Natrialba swarupiae]|nr:hypothetical protein [Natrialba swarupiae]